MLFLLLVSIEIDGHQWQHLKMAKIYLIQIIGVFSFFFLFMPFGTNSTKKVNSAL